MGRVVHARAYVGAHIIDFYPTMCINPNKEPDQLPWILQYNQEDNQSDEETDLYNDDPSTLPITLETCGAHPPLLHRHDLVKEHLMQRMDENATQLIRGVSITVEEVHLDQDIKPTGSRTPDQSTIMRQYITQEDDGWSNRRQT